MRKLLIVFVLLVAFWLVAAVLWPRECVAYKRVPYLTRQGTRGYNTVCVAWKGR